MLFTEEEPLRVHFLDVGQGDAIVLETPNSHRVVIDAGRGIQVLSALDDIVSTRNRNIDVVVMTHPDEDHIGGFIPILERYTVGTILQSFAVSESSVYKQVMEAIEKEKAGVHTIQQPRSFLLDGVQFDILWPLSTEVTETNAASVALLVTYGNTEIVLTGDAPTEIENFLIESFPEKLDDIEILKAGHHGSKTATTATFLQHTKPNAIVYSAGKDNPYGHPHDIVLSRVRVYAEKNPTENLTEYYTANGTVSFCITPTQFSVCN